jgi:hypothetical protein
MREGMAAARKAWEERRAAWGGWDIWAGENGTQREPRLSPLCVSHALCSLDSPVVIGRIRISSFDSCSPG